MAGLVVERAGETGGAAACVEDVIESAGRAIRAAGAALRRAVRSWRARAAVDGGLTAVVVEPFVAYIACGCAGAIIERAGTTTLARKRS